MSMYVCHTFFTLGWLCNSGYQTWFGIKALWMKRDRTDLHSREKGPWGKTTQHLWAQVVGRTYHRSLWELDKQTSKRWRVSRGSEVSENGDEVKGESRLRRWKQTPVAFRDKCDACGESKPLDQLLPLKVTIASNVGLGCLRKHNPLVK